VELLGGCCGGHGHRYRVAVPVGMAPGTPFGPGICSLLSYLHNSYNVGFERLSQLVAKVFGLAVSQDTIGSMF